jgi:flavin-dependent dehydrogenase
VFPHPERQVDLLIAGGGPAGTACAIALSRAGRAVTLLERSSYDLPRVGEALPPEVHRPLSELAVWERFLAEGHTASPGIMCVWGAPEVLLNNDFIANPFGTGWHVDRTRFDAMLAEAAAEAGAEFTKGARLTRIARGSTGLWLIEASSGEARIGRRARAIVDATGRAAALARRLGIRRIIHDRLIGLWAIVAGRTDHNPADRRTLIEPIECGWWYTALLPNGRHAAALMTDSDLLPAGAAARNAFWRDCLKRAPHTMSRLGLDARDERFRIVPACSSRPEVVVGPGWLAVGDAAMSFDPLSSRGVTWALESGLAAAQAHDTALRGDLAPTHAFARRAEADFASYLVGRSAIYTRERRWRDSPFWRRRQAAQQTGSHALRGFS